MSELIFIDGKLVLSSGKHRLSRRVDLGVDHVDRGILRHAERGMAIVEGVVGTGVAWNLTAVERFAA